MLELSDLAIREAEQTMIKSGIEQRRTSRVYEQEAPGKPEHNTLAIEEALMGIVRRANTGKSTAEPSRLPRPPCERGRQPFRVGVPFWEARADRAPDPSIGLQPSE